MAKFLLIQSRPEREASDDEFRAFCRFGGLNEDEVDRLLMHEMQPEVDLSVYDGILMAGGPGNFAYDEAHKSPEQRAFEPWLLELVAEIMAQETPFFGACLGMGALVTAAGGQLSLEAGEAVGAVDISLTTEGAADPLLVGLPREFSAFVGHKEGIKKVPAGITVLAENEQCVQMLRVGTHAYGVQFHPELDPAGLALRIETYKNAGYFAPEEADELIAAAWASDIGETATEILRKFVDRYRSNNP